ncbi:transposase family protein [Streptomyces sp. NPDC002088]|uniref:transposase family protein n=1 Tax=Streptomyces sp. NPDC002088 TaxID=3154665 RepID=UPI003322D9FA
MPRSEGCADGNALVMGDVYLSAEGLLFPGTTGVRVERVEALANGTLVHLSSTRSSRTCPDCGIPSRRVHSRYGRQLDDRPIAGRALLLRLTVRRFFCDTPTCLRRTFVEQIDGCERALSASQLQPAFRAALRRG